MDQATQPTTRELQLELQIWMERANALQTKGQLLQTQAVILDGEMKSCKANIERLQAVLAPKVAETSAESAPAEAAAA